uniref:Thyroglobulin type-1 domain-containing protein n=1 Tax=Photinus pyralis TaxID=7054 RepID=A0A1Y1L736_PHOPY
MFRTQLHLCGIILVIIVPAIISMEVSVQESHKCPNITECPFRPQSCNEDDECNPDSNCCESPCGRICTKQLRTGCETLHNAASRRAKSLGMDIKKVRTPRCNLNGGFEPVQCDNEIVSSCWCVDEQGFEIAGTKAPAVALVNCTAPKPCAGHTCRMFCPHGFALNDDGCPLCKCRDPCENVKCPKTLDCQLEELACSDPPCPPIPTCKRGRSLDNICPVGGPLRISETVRPFLCGNEPSKPTCPPLYQCLVQPGNDYGVCCPASLKIQKSGSCPAATEKQYDCGLLCTHDLECPSVQKCCSSDQCGSSCVHPKNVTECFHQKTLSSLLAVNERVGRGYVPQCTDDGEFTPKQCSKNGLVCWCVDRMGAKLKGSMGGAKNVNCSLADARTYSAGRSIDRSMCEKLDCAAICEYGFKLDENGCSTCKCDDPCAGYACSDDEECVVVRESSCSDFLCPTLPVCRPKAAYVNPCKRGTPLTDDLRGVPVACTDMCPQNFECTTVAGSPNSVCCPAFEDEYQTNTETVLDTTATQETITGEEKVQTMCEYLKDFAENMEGTREGMSLALPEPSCDSNGNYHPLQCHNGKCICVDDYGTEIPKSRGKINTTEACVELRKSLDCLDLTCRMGCDYGFVLEEDSSCPSCVCRDPCESITCDEGQQCQIVEVSCKDHYCPPVPACLPKKTGQCPYLVPAVSTSCDFECSSNLACNSSQVCCSNGCGTQCTDPLLQTACQHHQAVTQHHAHESGTPANRVYIPKCADDGSYEPKQCNPATKECWCVDFRGFEISQTRTPLDNNLDCAIKSYSGNCPLYKCSEDCDHGFEMDANGCRTCNCIDPCASITCREDGESCRLVAIECIDSPCPPIPMCLPKRENPCQSGEPLKIGNEIATCGPEYETCPSSHKCQLSPLGEYAVCCPKPRDVCFEPVDKGSCTELDDERSLTRFYFNTKSNKCDSFSYSGCHGNHNNFHTEEMCNAVCPVLSQCERLREKNLKMSERFNKSTFIPRCDPANGNWKPVQCMEHVGVCWCVTPQGQTQKGTVVRGQEPDCNFRQARGRSRDKIQPTDVDLILEELMMHIASVTPYENPDLRKDEYENVVDDRQFLTRCEALKSQCDTQGKFLPAQCDQEQCWCVDEAGNQLPHTNSFKQGEQLCLPTPIEYVEVIIGFRGEYDDITATPVLNRIKSIINHYKGSIRDNEIVMETTPEALHIKFALVGGNKVDVAYLLEQMVKEQKLPGLFSDITKSSFIHQLGSSEPSTAERIIALEHREIVSQSPVSVIAPYHTAMIVIAAASAFVICTLTVLVILYRRKSITISHSTHKVLDAPQRFLSTSAPIYIELPNEQLTPPPIRQDDKVVPPT